MLTKMTSPSHRSRPIIKVNGDFTLPGDGRGVLIVTGGLTISGNRHWDGVLMVGNNLTSNGNNGVDGTVVTGLNRKLARVGGLCAAAGPERASRPSHAARAARTPVLSRWTWGRS